MRRWTNEEAMQLLARVQHKCISETQLALTMSLSIGQIRELLAGADHEGSSHFYSESIKHHAGMRMIHKLQER